MSIGGNSTMLNSSSNAADSDQEMVKAPNGVFYTEQNCLETVFGPNSRDTSQNSARSACLNRGFGRLGTLKETGNSKSYSGQDSSENEPQSWRRKSPHSAAFK